MTVRSSKREIDACDFGAVFCPTRGFLLRVSPFSLYSFTIHIMDRIEQQILRNLTLHPAGLAAQELRSTIRPRVSQPTLWRRLDRLRAMGRIRAIGRGRATRYVNQDSDHSIADMRSKTLHIAVGRKLIRIRDWWTTLSNGCCECINRRLTPRSTSIGGVNCSQDLLKTCFVYLARTTKSQRLCGMLRRLPAFSLKKSA